MIKAMILAAGRGERMRPLTDTCPKPLLKIKQKALIEYHLSALKKAGISEVVINHAWLGEQLEKYLGNGDNYGLCISYSAENKALETAGGIIQALPHLVGADKNNAFIVVNGDIFTDYDYSNLVKISATIAQKSAYLVLVHNPEHHPDGDFFLAGNQVLENQPLVNNKYFNNIAKYTFSGIGLYHVDFFSGLAPGKRALAPLLRAEMKNSKVTGELYSGSWTDVGTVERLLELNG